MRTTLSNDIYQSVQFGGSDGRSVVNDDVQNHLNPVLTTGDSKVAGRAIQTRTGVLDTYQQATGAQSAPSIVQVQMLQDDGLVRVPGTNQMVKPEVLEGLKKSAPQLFVSEADKAAEAKAESDNSKDQEALRESLARHSDDQAEAAHMMFVGEVPQAEAVAMLVQMHRDGVPTENTLHRVGEAMGLSPDEAVTTLNKMAGGVQNQLTALATAHGVDPVAFSDWMRSSRREERLKAMTTHVLSRDVFGAWNSHLVDFKARTGPKR
jgi:hypothetical protein